MDRRLDPVDELIDIAREAQACGDHETALQALRRANGLAPMRQDIRRRLAEVLDGAGRVRAVAAREAEFRQSSAPRRASASVFAAPGARSADPAWDGYGAIDSGSESDSAPREGLLQSLVRRLSFGAPAGHGGRDAKLSGTFDAMEAPATERDGTEEGTGGHAGSPWAAPAPASPDPPSPPEEPAGPGAVTMAAAAFSATVASATGVAAKGAGVAARTGARTAVVAVRLARRPGLRGWALFAGYAAAIGYVSVAVVQSNRLLSRTVAASAAPSAATDRRDTSGIPSGFTASALSAPAATDDEGNGAPIVVPAAAAVATGDPAEQSAVAAARAALSQGKLEDAAKLFPETATSADAAELRTDLAAALDRKGTEALEASNFEKAVGFHQKAVKVSGERGTRFLYHLGNALLYAAREAKGEKSARPKYESAADALQRCVKADPSHDLAWAALGDALTKLDRSTDAAAAYRKGLVAVTDTIKAQGANAARNARLAKLKDRTGTAKMTSAQRAETKPAAAAKVSAN